ncbi:putative igr protein domain-containing protein [Erysiphe neolycopersici]|uniref:Small ribosomal subunit protein mS41 n=1 Tax=Erysiphe neolycopersici TaxID=212602 RepID=A0A420HH76_9PEZI|nr:putative igr protein domain-containing protein [Erysiphe neolycopersici]
MTLVLFKYSRLKSAHRIPLPFKHINQVRNSTSAAESLERKPLSAKRRFFWVPRPSKFCPDVNTFLSLIGRNMSEHASKFPGWASLFRLESPELKRLGIEPPRTRRYLLLWREKYRQGNLGAGADFKYIKDGVAHLRIASVPKDPKLNKKGIEYIPSGLRKIVINIPPGVKSVEDLPPEKRVPVKGYRVKGTNTIVGPYALPAKDGKGAVVTRKEGMWEIRRGRKIDGGERRQAEVRAKRKREEKRTAAV